MINLKTLALTTAAFASLSASAIADSGASFTSHFSVDEKSYQKAVEALPAEEKLEIREYLNYEEREPCQFYQPIPQGFMKQGCDITPIRKAQTEPKTTQKQVLADYEVHFAFDSAHIDPAAGTMLERVAREIKTYNPSEVVVAGHADRSGPSDYNIALSQQRAHSVSDALTAQGVTNRVLDEEAYGESHPEVLTADGVRNAENRRVEIQFLK